MAFVSGLMGPYMSPIPINSSLGMATSLIFGILVSNPVLRAVPAAYGVAHIRGPFSNPPHTLNNQETKPWPIS